MHISSQTKTPSSSVIANLRTPKAQLSIGTVEAGEGAFWRKGWEPNSTIKPLKAMGFSYGRHPLSTPLSTRRKIER